MIKPNPLKIGDRVALIAPSSPVSDEKLQVSLESISFLGLIPVPFSSCTGKNGYLSGSDQMRANDVMDAFLDPSIDGIFCIRGGYGATRILPLLNYDLIREHPKLFVGYSDITALHTVFQQKCNLVTIHGPMPSTGYHKMDYFSLEQLAKMIFKNNILGKIENPEYEQFETLSPGFATGQLTGGNLSVLASTLGSPYEIDTKDKLLFLEDVGEKPYQVDRSLTALSLAGKFEDCSGVIFGTFTECMEDESEPSPTLTIREIIEQVVLPFGKPVLGNFRCGHSYPTNTLALGARVRLDADYKLIEFLEES